MGKFGNVCRITESVGGRTITFRSKLEYRWACYCQLRKEVGLIKDWWYEDQETFMQLVTQHCGNIKGYLPDFCILTNDGEYEIEETKGYFPSKDYMKMKLAALQFKNKITLIFADLHDTPSKRKEYNRAKKLESLLKRVVYDANKTIFTKMPRLGD